MQSSEKFSICKNFSSGLHRRRRFGRMPLLFFFYNPSHHHHNPFFSYLIHISWRALEVWNCLKLIHYWIFSRRLKSLAPLPHNSAPIDCLGPNISQGCTEHFFFFSVGTLSQLYRRRLSCAEAMQMVPTGVFVRLCADSAVFTACLGWDLWS